MTKEQQKKAKLKEELLLLQQAHVSEAGFGEGKLPDVGIWELDAVPFKFLKADEQFLLAVERVSIAEIRATISPSEADVSDYPCTPGAEVFDYSSVLTLNDGDPTALRALAVAVRGEAGCMFHMVELPSEEVTDVGANAVGNDDEAGEGPVPVISDERLSDDFVVGYLRHIPNQTAFVNFDLYDPEQQAEYPVATIAIRVSMPGSELQGSRYTKADNKLVWEYVFTMHCPENEKPRDASVKQRYARLKTYLRSISGYAGNIPSSL